jgi:hypothetical protein
MKFVFGLAAAIVVLGAAAAHAQTTAEFIAAFSGKWTAYERRLATGSAACTLDFSGLSVGDRMSLKTAGCAAPLGTATTWSIVGNQLVLFDATDQTVATLGGNQRRISGQTPANVPLILERVGGDGSAATLQGAFNASGCYYLGYTQTCAERTELGAPLPGADGSYRIMVETNLNAHVEPRGDADTLGTVKQGTCVTADACTMSSDGPWCRAQFGSGVGWLRKFTLRQNRWPVVTFTNSCPQ